MHTCDSKTAKALQDYLTKKSETAQPTESSDAPRILPADVDPDLQQRLYAILAASAAGCEEPVSTNGIPVLDSYRVLLAGGFPETVGVLLQYDPTLLGWIEIGDLELIACTEANIGRWIDAGLTGDPAEKMARADELRTVATKEPERALMSALATWCCKSADVKQLRKLVPLVAADLARGSQLRLLEVVALRDKDGQFMTSWLRASADHLEPAAERIRANPKLLRHAIDSVPKWFRHPNAEALPPLFMEVVRDYPRTTGKKRAEVSGIILTLAGALVTIIDNSSAATTLAQELQSMALGLWKSAVDTGDRHRTWAPIQSGNHTLSAGSGPGLSPDQAKQLGLAIIRARKGKDALTELESAYVNLGATRFGEVGNSVSYDATIHNDLDGGLLPGDPVTIVRTGLRFGDAGVVKADVRNLEQP